MLSADDGVVAEEVGVALDEKEEGETMGEEEDGGDDVEGCREETEGTDGPKRLEKKGIWRDDDDEDDDASFDVPSTWW